MVMVWCEYSRSDRVSRKSGKPPKLKPGVSLLLLAGSLFNVFTTLNVSEVAQAQPTIPSDTPDPSDVRQGNPNEEQFPQDTPAPNQFENLPVLEETPGTGETLPDAGTGASVFVSNILVEGSTIYSDDRLNEIVNGFEGRELTLEELQAAADAVTQIYLNDGYITTRAVLVDQEIVEVWSRFKLLKALLRIFRLKGQSGSIQNTSVAGFAWGLKRLCG